MRVFGCGNPTAQRKRQVATFLWEGAPPPSCYATAGWGGGAPDFGPERWRSLGDLVKVGRKTDGGPNVILTCKSLT